MLMKENLKKFHWRSVMQQYNVDLCEIIHFSFLEANSYVILQFSRSEEITYIYFCIWKKNANSFRLKKINNVNFLLKADTLQHETKMKI